MFRAMISPIFRSTRMCVTDCGIMHPRSCRLPVVIQMRPVLFSARRHNPEDPSSILLSDVFIWHSLRSLLTEDTPNSRIELISNILASDAQWYGTGAARRWTFSEWLPDGRGWTETAFYSNHGHSFLEHMVPNVLTVTHCEWRCLYSKPSVIRPNWEGRGGSLVGEADTSDLRGPLPSLLPWLRMRFYMAK